MLRSMSSGRRGKSGGWVDYTGTARSEVTIRRPGKRQQILNI